LGFKYEQRKKGYYVDGHEKPATIEYRKAFVQRYLTYKSRAHRLIQITREESKKLEEEPFGGNLSVRRDPISAPLLIFGHDECIFKQYTLRKKSWTGPSGETVLVPKDDGQGIMISMFQSCEFGFGMDITPDLLKEVNITREGKKYNDTKAAISRRGTDIKKQITSSPFIVEFEYGANLEGYWSYDHMVL
jgi:hypothetical protein